jgi:N-acetylglucosaminyldiphosphoundecaprenol N-acetyl-beta-D-mannosaminyltransferase
MNSSRALFLDTPIDTFTMQETVETAVSAMATGSKITHVAINVAKLVKMRSDEQLRADVTGADIIGIDGMGIVLGARLLGIAVPERVSGIDLMAELLAQCAAKGFKPYFLGARPEVLAAATAAAQAANSGLKMAGMHHGYFRPDESERIVTEINESKADCLFIGMPTPHKERFLAAYRTALSAPFVMGVGGSFDVMAGKVLRAPLWAQRAGLEWLFRAWQEPRRMIWRYAETNTLFVLLLAQELLKSRFPSHVRGTSANSHVDTGP